MKIFNFKQFNQSINPDLKIGAMGDVICNQIANKYFENKNPWTNEIIEWARNLDILIITLDGTFPGDNPKSWNPKVIGGENIIDILPRGKKTIINLGNNHSFDMGLKGFENLKNYIEKCGLHHVGAGINREDAETPLTLVYEKFKIKVFSASHHGCHPRMPLNDGGEVAYLDSQSWWKKIKKKQNNFNIILLHGGVQGSHFPSPKAIEISQNLIKSKSDMVLWSHAHVIQGLSNYRNKLICYGLGNALQMPLYGDILSKNSNQEYDKGILLDINLSNLKVVRVGFSFFKRIGGEIILDESYDRLKQYKRYNSKIDILGYGTWWKCYRIYQDILLRIFNKLFIGNIFKNILSIKSIHFKNIIFNIKNTKSDSIDV